MRGERMDVRAVRRLSIVLATLVLVCWPAVAKATPPTLDSVEASGQSIQASWTLPPGMTGYRIEVASSSETYPDGDSKGGFLAENLKQAAWLTQGQFTTWVSPALPGGGYYVHIGAYDSITCSSPLGIGCEKEWSLTRAVTVPHMPPKLWLNRPNGSRLTASLYFGEFMAGDFIEIATAVPGPPTPAMPAAGGSATITDRAPSFKLLRVARRQSVRRLLVRVVVNEGGTVTVNGTVAVGSAAKVFRLRTASARTEPGTRVTLRPRLPRKALAAVQRALRRHRKVVANLTIAARDVAGKARVENRVVRLRR